ncbi:hypothetical protein SODALDRAFT_360187 [Sodiomyces alkalinus F11]|uniref:Uncharacterized protein n=1 Tax=Sodiomyces alkalinus (strain CBS 110278 / VKM F-3762 / F11) TaxID=1314773 RepID=A0A3N2PTR3_SODAK|nr:hypothetical protein SODALDRAFT_360187 [Sodiomyces alkalinus F11]ROT37892.1 hypothetical protein SODALDRAFT_360187 [Sodiomyces alkalinus F11]
MHSCINGDEVITDTATATATATTVYYEQLQRWDQEEWFRFNLMAGRFDHYVPQGKPADLFHDVGSVKIFCIGVKWLRRFGNGGMYGLPSWRFAPLLLQDVRWVNDMDTGNGTRYGCWHKKRPPQLTLVVNGYDSKSYGFGRRGSNPLVEILIHPAPAHYFSHWVFAALGRSLMHAWMLVSEVMVPDSVPFKMMPVQKQNFPAR